jgi:tripartite-type tricarboxylate transporter receptor subunit TctC
VVERLNRELNDVLRSDEIRAKMQEQGAIGGSGSAAEFAGFVQREQERYARVVKAANIKE